MKLVGLRTMPVLPDQRLAELESHLEVLRKLRQQGRAVGHLVAELEAEPTRGSRSLRGPRRWISTGYLL